MIELYYSQGDKLELGDIFIIESKVPLIHLFHIEKLTEHKIIYRSIMSSKHKQFRIDRLERTKLRSNRGIKLNNFNLLVRKEGCLSIINKFLNKETPAMDYVVDKKYIKTYTNPSEEE